ncbi:hypothetical protein FisN_5Hu258 [Fistulifera solaris]|uniref:Uncharacterized protein n=1 Tax=Fistulifera solaris TaxID=1519565 RepID=A0A1Z5JS84_FISSO|nr:hypothetical protein FisN_5Hu258 [Fistulifera solaris]|eukprot:GAX16885.1 hypothetical protein FisN_5Hu258 [Fistulifera solaris]
MPLAYKEIRQIDREEELDGHQTSIGSLEGASSPLEIENDETYYDFAEQALTWKDPWFFTAPLILLLELPLLSGNALVFYHLTGRVWAATLPILHLLLAFLSIRCSVVDAPNREINSTRLVISLSLLADILLAGFLYPFLYHTIKEAFFIEPDGTDVIEWSNYKRLFEVFAFNSWVFFILRTIVAAIGCLARLQIERPYLVVQCIKPPICSLPSEKEYRMRSSVQRISFAGIIIATFFSSWCIFSVAVHFLPPFSLRQNAYANEFCDPIDETECILPFPSFFHLRPDETSETGWRVNLQEASLPLLRGGISMHAEFYNELDGFSTMGPILFYIDGLKEAHEAGAKQLKGQREIAKSVTQESVTFLVDVKAAALVPHSAEIDYLDPKHPMVLLFPARPLKHNTHYAVAVVNATNGKGDLLARSSAMEDLFKEKPRKEPNGSNIPDQGRMYRYRSEVIPALQRAAVWLNLSDNPAELQLLFDFPTISETSQLSPARAVRDGTIATISKNRDWKWSEHVRTNRIEEYNCDEPENVLARTVHAEMDVPWFLQHFGPGRREAFLDPHALDEGRTSSLGIAKFLIHIPCSARSAALGHNQSRPIRSFMEYGHGLFFSRSEASDDFLLRMAHDEGYVIMAMDWRGMSVFDLLVVIKTLISKPSQFQSVRDNLIQGYANKIALQHFARNGMTAMDWFDFAGSDAVLRSVPFVDDESLSFVFYGISQGGILGAGYCSLAGTTALIDRAILGVPGTPFALIMTRSLDFQGYDKLLLMNFVTNRHVRIFLTIIQMGWDATEGAGFLAPPIREPYPRLLLQAGLGDVIVPALAAEALARAFNAILLPASPRDVYGLEHGQAASSASLGPNVTFTELLFTNDYSSLPFDNTFAVDNPIHDCVRRDKALIAQITEFINTGRIIDPCEPDNCIREKDSCWD